MNPDPAIFSHEEWRDRDQQFILQEFEVFLNQILRKISPGYVSRT